MSGSARVARDDTYDTDRLRTGVDLLDRKLDGGLPPGSLAVLSANPASQSELFLYEIATERPTLYLTPMRSVRAVRDVVSRLSLDTSDVVVAGPDASSPVESTLELVDSMPTSSTLVLDPLEPYEHMPTAEYWTFLNALKDHLAATEAVAYLHGLDGHHVPPDRDVTEYMADVVFDMTTQRHGETLENTLTVPKFRGGQAIDDVIKLSLTSGVDVDISRNIV